MPFITREDGELFVIPSYRDVLSARNKNQLKKDIVLLSQSYGDYITLQRKGGIQYEVAFATEAGYLLGESIWQYFKRPLDMIYCEAIPHTLEALLVIVKNGSVYLDGSFPFDSIPEELIIFLTQKNEFEIYTYGDVPISQTPVEGKFSFEATSVKSFTVLDKPVFPTLPLLKIYRLQFVDNVLKSHGIGVFPMRKLVLGVGSIILVYMAYSYLTQEKSEILPTLITQPNPYQGFYDSLKSPAPDQEMGEFIRALNKMFTLPGWVPVGIAYEASTFTAQVRSNGGKIEMLMDWADANSALVDLRQDGIYIVIQLNSSQRPAPKRIYPINDVLASLVDDISNVYPGNRFKIKSITKKGPYTTIVFDITIEGLSPIVLSLIGQQFRGLPFVLKRIALTVTDASFSGTISLEALGN